MPVLLVNTEFEHVSGFPEDSVQNRFVVITQDTTVGTLTSLFNAVEGFYNDERAPDGSSICGYMSSIISRNAGTASMKAYDITDHLDGTPHGSPIDTATFTPDAAGALQSLPEEVAVAITLRATGWQELPVEAPDNYAGVLDPGVARDRPRQRRTGKLYIGPLNTNAAWLQPTRIEPRGQFRTALLNAAEAFFDALQAFNATWAVWSKSNVLASPITHAQVDNAFDIQRRRGPDSTVRDTRVLFP